MWARRWFGMTALVIAIGLVTVVYDTATTTAGFFKTPVSRVLNLPFFFTVESNIILLVTCTLLALRLERRSTVFAAFRLAGVLGITLTGIVYYAVLRGTVELSGAGFVADFLLHTVSPILAVVGWLAFGPRRLASTRVVRLTAVFPLLYLAVTLVRGAIVGFYPYPFLNAGTYGYGTVAVNSVVVAAVFFAAAFGAAWVDRRLSYHAGRRGIPRGAA